MEDRREARVPALGHACRHLHGTAFVGVVVEVEMLGPQDSEVEGLVLYPTLLRPKCCAWTGVAPANMATARAVIATTTLTA